MLSTLQSLEVLLEYGVSPYVTDADGLRPVDLAEECGHKQCVELLVKYEKMLPPVQTMTDQVWRPVVESVKVCDLYYWEFKYSN